MFCIIISALCPHGNIRSGAPKRYFWIASIRDKVSKCPPENFMLHILLLTAPHVGLAWLLQHFESFSVFVWMKIFLETDSAGWRFRRQKNELFVWIRPETAAMHSSFTAFSLKTLWTPKLFELKLFKKRTAFWHESKTVIVCIFYTELHFKMAIKFILIPTSVEGLWQQVEKNRVWSPTGSRHVNSHVSLSWTLNGCLLTASRCGWRS